MCFPMESRRQSCRTQLPLLPPLSQAHLVSNQSSSTASWDKQGEAPSGTSNTEASEPSGDRGRVCVSVCLRDGEIKG